MILQALIANVRIAHRPMNRRYDDRMLTMSLLHRGQLARTDAPSSARSPAMAVTRFPIV